MHKKNYFVIEVCEKIDWVVWNIEKIENASFSIHKKYPYGIFP